VSQLTPDHFTTLARETGADPKAMESRFEADLLRILGVRSAIVPIFPATPAAALAPEGVAAGSFMESEA
jgi:hypothetical protein